MLRFCALLGRGLLCFLAVLLVSDVNAQDESPAAVAVQPADALEAYVRAEDPSYRWEVREESRLFNCDVMRLHLTSQTWQGLPWRHVLTLIKPPNVDATRNDALLVIAGGSWKKEWPENGPDLISAGGEAQMMTTVAAQFGCVIAIVSQVPFQPQMGDKYEDEIIAATFRNYIQTQDPTWPLLLPMVKSAVRAMDATSQAAAEHWDLDIKDFTVTGASKRGWTTWLSGATDSRVVALAPMVIDMLNMSEQMQHQIDTWGEYSEQIADYTELQLPKFLGTPNGKNLQRIVDPFAYREKLTRPKLLIFGTNDRYWPLDACNLYWDQLLGEKYLLYVPNQGHSIEDYVRVIGSVSALHRSRRGAGPMPDFKWEYANQPEQVELSVDTESKVDSVRGWVAVSDTKDFRNAQWSQQVCRRDATGQYQLAVQRPDAGYKACFAEVVFTSGGVPAFLSTNVSIFGSE